MTMVVSQPWDHFSQRNYAGGGQYTSLPHTSAKLFARPMRPGDKFLVTTQD